MIDLMAKKYYFFIFSFIIIAAGIAGYIVNGGFNLDIQFQGGTVMEIKMNNNKFDTVKIEDTLTSSINKKVTAQKSETLNAKDKNQKINLLVLNIAGKEEIKKEDRTKIIEVLKKETNITDSDIMAVRYIEPSIGKELMGKAINSVILASILIIFYIWIRFKIMSGLSAGVMAVIGLLHDVVIMLAVYAIFRIPLNESFVAAVLTVIGYSMNDTIIIYDRIRENSGLLRKVPVSELVNKSIIQTLARSINTVVTVLICLITVYLYAYYSNIASIKEFSFPLIIGIASGCYSSIFVTSPLWVIWKESQNKKKISAKPAKA